MESLVLIETDLLVQAFYHALHSVGYAIVLSMVAIPVSVLGGGILAAVCLWWKK